MPNTVRRVLMPTTWVRHYYLHVAEGKMESQKNNLSWPRCPSATICQSQDSNAYTAHLWRDTCHEILQQRLLSAGRDGGQRAVCQAAVCFSSGALNNWEMLNSIWCWASVILCHLGPLLGPPALVLCRTRCLTYPTETDVQSRAA